MRYLGVLVIVLIAVGAWFAVGPGAGAPTGACAIAPAAPSPSASERTDPPAVAWTTSELPTGFDDPDEQIMLDVVAFGDGFVAVGRESSGPKSHAFFLRSADGISWAGQPGDDQRFAGVEITSLVTDGGRLYGIGSASTNDRGGSRVAVWVTDDGRSWRQATGPFDDAHATSVAVGDSGLLMVGGTNDGRHPLAWSSRDGLAWESAPIEQPVDGGLGGLAHDGDGWLAAGSIASGRDGPSAPVIWRSRDGVGWSCHVLDAGGFNRGYASKLYRSGDGWLAVGGAADGCGFGGSCPGHSAAWFSTDGVAWTDVLLDGYPSAHVGVRNAFVGVGNGTWLLRDGHGWERVSDGETSGALAGQADALAATDDGRLVVVGTTYDSTSDADAWIAVGEFRIDGE